MIAHIRRRGHEPVKPTVRMMKYWWSRLNRDCFGGELLPCQLTFGPSPGWDVLGLCFPLDNGRVRIHVDERVCTRVELIAVIAHEMVHQYQHQNGHAMHHGALFKTWSDAFRANGLNI